MIKGLYNSNNGDRWFKLKDSACGLIESMQCDRVMPDWDFGWGDVAMYIENYPGVS